MPEREVTITADVGLHARPAARFVKAAMAAGGPVTIRKHDGESVDASSIVAVLTLNVACGDKVILTAEDPSVLDGLSELLSSAD